MFVEGLQTTDLHADQRQLVTQIRKSTAAITDSLREILDVSKLDAGVVQPRVSSFAVAQVLDRIALEMRRNLAARKGLEFEVVRSRCWVVSDPMLLYRIVLNLAQNAIVYTEATPSAAVIISATCRCVSGDSGQNQAKLRAHTQPYASAHVIAARLVCKTSGQRR